MESVDDVTRRQAIAVNAEQDKMMRWFRRHTPLSDEQLMEAMRDHTTAAFNAGHEIGFTDALHKAKWSARRNRIMSWITFISTAALVACLWLLFQC